MHTHNLHSPQQDYVTMSYKTKNHYCNIIDKVINNLEHIVLFKDHFIVCNMLMIPKLNVLYFVHRIIEKWMIWPRWIVLHVHSSSLWFVSIVNDLWLCRETLLGITRNCCWSFVGEVIKKMQRSITLKKKKKLCHAAMFIQNILLYPEMLFSIIACCCHNYIAHIS